ncbi:MAG: autotransporter domain-containing protein [Gammaproteobacteria bacterium]|nr:autotransporter domain-containing protein [Gammaproteobacteria bacterium]
MVSLLLRTLVLGLALAGVSAHGQTQQSGTAGTAAALKTSVGVLGRAGSSLAKDLIQGRVDGGGAGEGSAALHTAAAGSWAAGPGASPIFNAGHNGNGYTVGAWAAAATLDFSGRQTLVTNSEFRYGGRLNALHIGTDRWRGPDNMAGLSVAHTFGDLDGAGEDRDFKTRMTGVHPYYAHWLSPNLYLWTAAGLSKGTAKVTETVTAMNASTIRRANSNLSSTMAGGGVNGRMQWSDAVDIGLRASLVYTKGRLSGATYDDSETLPESEATTLRLASEWEVGRHITTNKGAVRPFLTAGFRQDYRDADGDAAWNLGSGAEFSSEDGLVIRVQGKNQVSTSNTDHRENSLSAEVRWAWTLGRLGLAPYTTLNMNAADRDWIGGVRMAVPGTGLRLGFEAGVDADGADYGNLFSGEWRF